MGLRHLQLRLDTDPRSDGVRRWAGRPRGAALLALSVVLLGAVRPAASSSNEMQETAAAAESPTPPAARLVESIADPELKEILQQVLDRNPEIAAMAARTRAADQRPSQTSALPDPMLGLTTFLLAPQTRVGPQRAIASYSQKLPWFGKLSQREKVALYDAAALQANLEARRLQLVTEARTRYYEIAFLDAFARITREDRQTLDRYEELARVRYAAGIGLQQAVIKIQAEITKDDTRLLDIAGRRVETTARLNALRDQPDATALGVARLPEIGPLELDKTTLRARALAERPEVASADATIARSEAGIKLARKQRDPDVTLGLTYIFVGPRDDPAAAVAVPEDNGQDAMGISASVNLPLWRSSLSAGIQEATESRSAAEESRRQVFVGIQRELDDLLGRIPLIRDQLRLFDDVLVAQAEEALRSAESAYAAGSIGALDLLDAERVLLEVRTSAARTHTDLAVAVAGLEGAIAGPLDEPASAAGESR